MPEGRPPLHIPRVALRTWAKDTWRDPVAWTELLQLVKTAVAAVVAWVLAVQVFHLPQPFLAPWAALLVVHATVYRTFSQGLKQVLATVLGVILAWAAGNLLGLDPLAIGVMMFAGLLLGELRWLRAEQTTIAATALVVLTTGFSDEDYVLVGRLVDTAIGIAVGFAVNLLAWPPLRDYSAALSIDAVSTRVGGLLQEMAAELRDGCGDVLVDEWVKRTRDIDTDIDEAWGLLGQARESGRLNLRRGARDVRGGVTFGEVLDRIEQAVAEARSMAQSLGHSISSANTWEDDFRHRWVALLDKAGAAIAEPDHGRLVDVRRSLRELADDLSTESLSALHWPEYGALILNLRNIATAMDRVAESHPVAPTPSGGRSRLRG